MKKRKTLLLLAIDALLVNSGIMLAFLLRFHGIPPERNFLPYVHLWYVLTIIYLGSFYLFGFYRKYRLNASGIFLSTAKAMNMATLFGVGFTYMCRHKFGAFPTSVFAISWLFNIFIISFSRILFLKRELGPKRVLIVGRGEKGGEVVTNLQRKGDQYEIVAIVQEIGEISPEVIKEKNIEEVIVASGREMSEEILNIIQNYRDMGVKFKLVPDLYEIFLARVGSAEIDGLPLVEIETEPISGFYWDIKRVMDLVISLVGLAIFSPFFLIIPILIKWDSKGSVLFRQERVGKDGKIFTLIKFRSMVENAEKDTGPIFASEDDSRLTRLGKFLRDSHLDELPQLINILKGEMSFVGPRPERPYFVEKFKKEIPGYMQRLTVRPGLTGLAQVYASYDVEPRNKLRYDLLYIRNYSPFLDMKIILRTILKIGDGFIFTGLSLFCGLSLLKI